MAKSIGLPKMSKGPQTPYRYSPIADIGNSVLLPGMEAEYDPGQAVISPDLKPIMGSGENTGTIFPLADPVPPPPPLPQIEFATAALPDDALVAGLPELEQEEIKPPEFPEIVPTAGEGIPGTESLGNPLPTETPAIRPLFAPELPPITFPDEQRPRIPAGDMPAFQTVPPLTESRFPALGEPPAGVTPEGLQAIEGGQQEVFGAVPLEPAVPIGGDLTSGWDSLAQAIAGATSHIQTGRQWAEQRSAIRAPIPGFPDGRLDWDSLFQGEPR